MTETASDPGERHLARDPSQVDALVAFFAALPEGDRHLRQGGASTTRRRPDWTGRPPRVALARHWTATSVVGYLACCR